MSASVCMRAYVYFCDHARACACVRVCVLVRACVVCLVVCVVARVRMMARAPCRASPTRVCVRVRASTYQRIRWCVRPCASCLGFFVWACERLCL
jgi:hypothetical protein